MKSKASVLGSLTLSYEVISSTCQQHSLVNRNVKESLNLTGMEVHGLHKPGHGESLNSVFAPRSYYLTMT